MALIARPEERWSGRSMDDQYTAVAEVIGGGEEAVCARLTTYEMRRRPAMVEEHSAEAEEVRWRGCNGEQRR